LRELLHSVLATRYLQMPENSQPRAVFLLGFMGAGKTSVGQALARRLGWRFVDLDQQIEMRAGRTIAEIFAKSGEPTFRALETAALRDLLAELSPASPAVIALGGGAVVGEQNAALLGSYGAPQVFLDAPFEVLRRRCGETIATRPLFREEARARLLYESRRPHYLKAQYRVDTASYSVEQASAEIARTLCLEPAKGE
jgi:shikimate kinase